MEEKANPYSQHIFLFPFRWNYETGNELKKSKKDPDIEDIHEFLDKDNWERDLFKTDLPGKFNQHVYFYPFVRDVLFENQDESNHYLRAFKFRLPENSFFQINIKKSPGEYLLDIDKITLGIYFTNVGILSFHLSNFTYKTIEDILKINEYGRRIFPQFLDKDTLADGTKEAFLADSITLKLSDREIKEDFKDYNDLSAVKENPDRLPSIIMEILGNKFSTGSNGNDGKIRICSVVDDRMFVLSWFRDKQMSEKLSHFNKEKNNYNYLDNDEWYKYLFIDTEICTCKNQLMRKDLLNSHTYGRWIENKTIYGISRYSFVMLYDGSWELYANHMVELYYYMIYLALVQRSSILNFSYEINQVLRNPGDIDKTSKISLLNERYLKFVNKLWFREVTAQEQGIEIYNMIVDKMMIKRDIRELNREINELFAYASLREEKKKNRLLSILTILGSIFIIPAFLTSYFGMNLFDPNLKISSLSKYIIVFAGIFLISFFSYLGIRFIKKNNYNFKWKSRLSVYTGIIILLAILILLEPVLNTGKFLWKILLKVF